MGHFKFKTYFSTEQLEAGARLEESDLCIQLKDDRLAQFEFIDDNPDDNVVLNPGIWAMGFKNHEVVLEKANFHEDKILEEFLHTKELGEKIDSFFSKFDVYKKYGIEVPKRSFLLFGPPGCHAKGTEILMYDGTSKKVEDVVVGDRLMGPDSLPREVLKLARGVEPMVKIKPKKGEEFIVNMNHILHLAPSGSEVLTKTPVNIKFSDWLLQKRNFKDRYKLKFQGVEFQNAKKLPIDPYILGIWLGDGHSNTPAVTTMDSEISTAWSNYAAQIGMKVKIQNIQNNKAKSYFISSGALIGKHGRNSAMNALKELNLIDNKHIPIEYKTATREDRLSLLAGLIDTDGTLDRGIGYAYTTKSDKLAEDIKYLARSLGFGCTNKKVIKYCYYNGKKREGTYNSIHIYGDTHIIPCKLPRKQQARPNKTNKDPTKTGFTYEILPEAEYFGFSLDKDHLYLTKDFMIHHNTGKTTALIKVCKQYVSDGKTAIILWHSDKIDPKTAKSFLKHLTYNNVDKLILVIEDLGGVEMDQVRIPSQSSLLSILDNQEMIFKKPILIISTTNHPENFLSNLTNRPQRFDDKIKMDYPPAEYRSKLLKFFNPNVTEEQCALIEGKKFAQFTPAHIKEIFIRSDLYDLTFEQSINQMYNEIEDYKKAFQQTNKLGL